MIIQAVRCRSWRELYSRSFCSGLFSVMFNISFITNDSDIMNAVFRYFQAVLRESKYTQFTETLYVSSFCRGLK